jgi:hypothetical protein
MMTDEEQEAQEQIHMFDRPWWKPTTQVVGVILLALILTWQFANLHRQQRDLHDNQVAIKQLVDENQRAAVTAQKLAVTAAEDTYHNCVVTRALEVWSKQLGHTDPIGDKTYVTHRHAIFNQLHNKLLEVDGINCTPPKTVSVKGEVTLVGPSPSSTSK